MQNQIDILDRKIQEILNEEKDMNYQLDKVYRIIMVNCNVFSLKWGLEYLTHIF